MMEELEAIGNFRLEVLCDTELVQVYRLAQPDTRIGSCRNLLHPGGDLDFRGSLPLPFRRCISQPRCA